jgi:general secretion pathway protein D
VTDANVLATPQLLTLDNVKARINVGSNVPFVTGSGTVGATGAILTTIVRQDVGVILEITPHLMEDDMIRLEVTQEITAVTNDPQVLGDDIAVGPTTRKRSATTTIMAKNGETVAMGGLIQEDSLFIRSKIPFLGDIPGLGWLFKSDTTQQNKLNLLLFLTPTIVKDSSQMNRLVEINKSRSELLKKEQLPDKDKPEIDW